MLTRLLALPIRLALSRLGAMLLAVTVLLPGQPIQAAAVLTPARPAPLLGVASEPDVNHPPVGIDDNLVAFADQDYQTLYVLDNDSDPDSGDTINIFSVSSPPHHGDIFRNTYSLDYKPFSGFSGVDTFKYVVEDRPQFTGGLTDTATVTVTVVANGAVGTTRSPFALYACGPDPSGCDTSRWTVIPTGGASGDTASGACNGAPGLSIADATLLISDRANAFDNGLTLWINGQQFAPRLPMTVTRNSLVSGPVLMGGVRVTMRYDGLHGSDTLRTLVTFNNISGVTKAITATLASNLGSNNHTTIDGSSDGNTSFSTTDRWLVTGNADLAHQGGIVDTHVLYGPGSPPVRTSAVYATTFKCNELPTPDSAGVRADFHLTLAAAGTGKLQRLLFFNQAHDTNEDALADAAVFNAEPVGLLAGLTSTELGQVANWNLLPISSLFLPFLKR